MSKTNSLTITYAIVYKHKDYPEYIWTRCGKCFNLKTKREIKKKYYNRCIGYNIKGKFYSLKILRTKIEKMVTFP